MEAAEPEIYALTVCPRCGGDARDEEFYGPCRTCRRDLCAEYEAEAREVEEAVFEPKMNVTPNAVAVKE